MQGWFWGRFLKLATLSVWVRCHKPRYWSTMDQYKATLLQEKQVQDTSLWFPYQLRPRQTTGNSRDHSLVQVPECGNKFNQAWESCTTIRRSGDQITQEKVVRLSKELISTLKNHMQVIVILLMQSGTTFVWINQPLWHHYDTIWKWCHPVLYSHWLVIVDYAKQVHTCKRYMSRMHIFYLIFLYFIQIYSMKYSCLSPYH